MLTEFNLASKADFWTLRISVMVRPLDEVAHPDCHAGNYRELVTRLK